MIAANPEMTLTRHAAVVVRDLCFSYGTTPALQQVNLQLMNNQVTAFIGPSGCGKSTLLRCINRMNDEIPGARVTSGQVFVDGVPIYHPSVDVVKLRREVGMVFQKSNPFPVSIFDNVAYGLRMRGERRHHIIEQAVCESLQAAALWDEVKDRLDQSAWQLSGGQQQRLCIARSIAVKPLIVLMDEPCSALDPIATAKVEELIWNLKSSYTIGIVTHNMQQASRISDHTAFFHLGELIECSPTREMFSNPRHRKTEDYLTGRFG